MAILGASLLTISADLWCHVWQRETYARTHTHTHAAVAFKVYDVDQDGFISNGELFQVLSLMVGANLTDEQLQQIVDKTIMYADTDGDGKVSFEEFCEVVGNSEVDVDMNLPQDAI